jgi:hypothetical protein
MGKTVAYLRASTDKQDLNHQRLELLEFARNQGCTIDEFVEITISSRKTSKQRRIDELVQRLNETDTLIVTELSRLGRSTAEVIALVNALLQRNIRLITIKQNLDIHQQDMVKFQQRYQNSHRIAAKAFEQAFGSLRRSGTAVFVGRPAACSWFSGSVLEGPVGVSKELVGIHVLLTRSLFAFDILRRLPRRVSLA